MILLLQQQINQLFMFHEASKLQFCLNENYKPFLQKAHKKKPKKVSFPLPKMPENRLKRLYHYSNTHPSLQPTLTIQTLSQVLFYSHLAFIQAHPHHDSAPLFCYIIAPSLPPLSAYPFIGKYHYDEHSIEYIQTLSEKEWEQLTNGLIQPSFFIGITSYFHSPVQHYHFKKYQTDIGHLLANLFLINQQFNFQGQLLSHFQPAMLDQLLRVSPNERCECIVNFQPNLGIPLPNFLPPIINQPHLPLYNNLAHTLQELTHQKPLQPLLRKSKHKKEQITEKRRIHSLAQKEDFEPEYTMPFHTFERILQSFYTIHLQLRNEWLPWKESVQFAFFINRVEGLQPGLYLLFLNDKQITSFRSQCKVTFNWTKVSKEYQFYSLFEAPLNEMISDICLNDPFVKNSALTVSFINSFKPFITTFGVSMYQRLFWEAGMLAELIRLESRLEKVDAVSHPFYYESLFEKVMGISHHEDFMNTYHLSIGKWK